MNGKISKNAFLEKIAFKKTPCFFVSPHLDDAVFSAGGLISLLAGKTDVVVLTIFSEAPAGRSTFSAKNFLRLCDYKKAGDLFVARRAEDKKMLGNLGVKTIHLGFEDAAWRKKTKAGTLTRIFGKIFPEFVSIYPFFKTGVVSGVISRHDEGLKEKIKEKLASEIGEKVSGKFLIFCPMGIGGHVDHLITREACEKICQNQNLIFWSDYPYNIKSPDAAWKMERVLTSSGFDKLEINTEKARKKEMILSYKTQAKPMFDNNPGVVPEIFYVKNNPCESESISSQLKEIRHYRMSFAKY